MLSCQYIGNEKKSKLSLLGVADYMWTRDQAKSEEREFHVRCNQRRPPARQCFELSQCFHWSSLSNISYVNAAAIGILATLQSAVGVSNLAGGMTEDRLTFKSSTYE